MNLNISMQQMPGIRKQTPYSDRENAFEKKYTLQIHKHGKYFILTISWKTQTCREQGKLHIDPKSMSCVKVDL